ncbi:MATE family efflux transporter [Ekhidna sp.]
MISRSLYKRAKASSLYGLSAIVPLVGQLLISLIIVRFHSANLWGDYVQNLILANIILLIGGFGNRDYIIKKISDKSFKAGHIWSASLALRFCVFIITLLVFLLIGWFSISPLLVIFWTFSTFLSNSFNSLIIHKKAFRISLIQELISVLILVSLTVGDITGLTVEKLVLFSIISLLIKLSFYFYYFRKYIIFQNISFPIPEVLKGHLLYFTPTLLGNIQGQSDVYLVALFLSPEQLGYYHIFARIIRFFQNLSGFVFAPHLKNILRLNRESIKNVISKSLRNVILLSFPAAAFIFFSVDIFYGLRLSPFVLVCLVLFFAPFYIYSPIIYFLFGKGLEINVNVLILLQVFISIALGIYLIKELNFYGAILISLFNQWIAAALFYIEFKRHK